MKIPKEVLVAGEVWTVGRRSKMGPDEGWAEADKRKITLHTKLQGRDLLKIFIHEILHALEDEYGFELPHDFIELVELPTANFLIDNGYVVLNRRKRKPKR